MNKNNHEKANQIYVQWENTGFSIGKLILELKWNEYTFIFIFHSQLFSNTINVVFISIQQKQNKKKLTHFHVNHRVLSENVPFWALTDIFSNGKIPISHRKSHIKCRRGYWKFNIIFDRLNEYLIDYFTPLHIFDWMD